MNSRRAGTLLAALLTFVAIVVLFGVMIGRGAQQVTEHTNDRSEQYQQMFEDLEG